MRLPKKQAIAALVLILIVLAVALALLAIMDLSWFFVALIALVVGVCVLRAKKPDFFRFKEEKKPSPAPGGSAAAEEAFSTRIILLLQNGLSTQQVQVDQPVFVIGRGAGCHLRLTGNDRISSSHAVIRFDKRTGSSTLMDNHSRNGTKLNGAYIEPDRQMLLHNGDMIQIEDRLLTVQSKNY